MVGVSLESCVSENSDSQEQRGDSTTNIGDNGQGLLISWVHRSPGDILETNTHLLECILAAITVIAPVLTTKYKLPSVKHSHYWLPLALVCVHWWQNWTTQVFISVTIRVITLICFAVLEYILCRFVKMIGLICHYVLPTV